MKSFKKRINLNIPLKKLSEVVIDKYNLGAFKANRLIKIGYEDFNYILTTDASKFVVKVFSNMRTDEDCKNLANRSTIPFEKGFSSPRIYKNNNDNLLIITIKEVKYRLLVMEYIDGKDFFSLKTTPNSKELSVIAKDLAKLNLIEFRPPFIYDKWAIINFEKEYESLIHLIHGEIKKQIDKTYREFKTCNFSKLKYGFVHGDLIETNVLRDKNGKLYYIDFSVSNYLPRIIDLAVTICDLCIDINDATKSEKQARQFLNDYEKISKLDNYEKKYLDVFMACHQAITVLETTREKALEGNTTKENEVFLNKGIKGIDIVLKISLAKEK